MSSSPILFYFISFAQKKPNKQTEKTLALILTHKFSTLISRHFLKELVERIWWKIKAVFLLPEHFLLMDMGIVKKRIIIDVGPQGVLQISSAGMIEGFFGVEIFDSRIFSNKKIWRVFFWVFSVLYDFWKFLRLTNPPWDFLGGLGFVGIFLRFWFLPPFDHPCHLTSGVPHLVPLGKGWRKSCV